MSDAALPGEREFPHLFSPLAIGNVTVRNRLMQSAHYKGFHAREGLTNNRDIHYQVERARGGIGLMITGARHAHPTSTGPGRFGVRGERPENVARDRSMTRAVHAHGAKIFAQLIHFGLQQRSGAMDDHRPLWGPSTMKSPAYNEYAKEMEPEEIHEVSEYFALTAAHARDAEFDGVELHYSHGYLHQQFMSFVYNKRSDEYGGTLDNIVRFPIETIERVRERVGEDFVVGVRISMSECTPGGVEIDTAMEIVKRLVATGKIDFVNATAGTYASHADQIPPGDYPENWLVERGARLRAAIRSVRDIPLFIVGHIAQPETAERIVAEDQADMVAMTRSQIADPEFAEKLRAGRKDEVIRCIRCNQGCIGRVMQANAMSCVVNPAAGREQLFGAHTWSPVVVPKHWVVVGGGPAGMTAARALARRGHRVTLFEKDARLGGATRLAAMLPRREKFGFVAEDLEHQLRVHGVDVRLGTPADADRVVELAPDGVIVATGAVAKKTGFTAVRPAVDLVPGTEQDNVFTVPEALTDPGRVGRRVLMFDEHGGRYAIGTAERLIDEGREVHVVTRFPQLAPGLVYTLDLGVTYQHVFGKGLTFTPNHWVRRIEGNRAIVFNIYTDRETTLDGFGSFVIAGESRPDDALYHALKGRLANVHRIGDCVAPRTLEQAIYEGMIAGRELFDNARFIEHGVLEEWDDAAQSTSSVD